MKHIRIISPSGTINPDFIEGASKRLRSWQYDVSESVHARGQYGRFSGTDAERLSDITAAFSDPDVDIILCARGGYGLQRIIDRVHAQSHLLNPLLTSKTLVGFSDITALHQLCGLNNLPSLHGLMCKHIATMPEECEALQLFRQALNGEQLTYHLPAHPLNRQGKVQGTLIGGNLSVLYGLQGTPYGLNALIDAHPEGCILFIEDIAERHYHIDRMIQNLRLSGVLQRIKGLIVGHFADCEPDPLMPARSIDQTILDAVAHYDYPVMFGFPTGHIDDNRPLWLNAPVLLSVDEYTSTLITPFTDL